MRRLTLAPAMAAAQSTLLVLAFLLHGCTLGEVAPAWGWNTSEIAASRAWSAENETSIQRPILLPQLLARVGNTVGSNVVAWDGRIIFTEVRLQVSDASFSDPCPVWLTCRDLDTGRLVFRRPFQPGCPDHLHKHHHLLAIGDRLFIGHSMPDAPPHEGCVGICWDIQKGEAVEESRLRREQLPQGMVLARTEDKEPFATDGRRLFVLDMDEHAIVLAALDVPTYQILWQQSVATDRPESCERYWWGIRFSESVLLASLTLAKDAFTNDARGGACVVAADASTGAVLWKKQTPLFPVPRSWPETSAIAVGPSRVYLPTASDVVEAWDAHSGEKVWACRLPGKIASPISVSEGVLAVLTTDSYPSGSEKMKEFCPTLVLIDAVNGTVLRTVISDLRLWPRDTNALAHVPGWFLLFNGGRVHGFPVDSKKQPQKWRCWEGRALGLIPVELPGWDYPHEQVDATHILAWPLFGGWITLFKSSP